MSKGKNATSIQKKLTSVLDEGRLDFDTVVNMRQNLEKSIIEVLLKIEKRVDGFKKIGPNYIDLKNLMKTMDTDLVNRYCSDLQSYVTDIKSKLKGISNLYR